MALSKLTGNQLYSKWTVVCHHIRTCCGNHVDLVVNRQQRVIRHASFVWQRFLSVDNTIENSCEDKKYVFRVEMDRELNIDCTLFLYLTVSLYSSIARCNVCLFQGHTHESTRDVTLIRDRQQH